LAYARRCQIKPFPDTTQLTRRTGSAKRTAYLAQTSAYRRIWSKHMLDFLAFALVVVMALAVLGQALSLAAVLWVGKALSQIDSCVDSYAPQPVEALND
jgi:hypothetical protein